MQYFKRAAPKKESTELKQKDYNVFDCCYIFLLINNSYAQQDLFICIGGQSTVP